jgi:hypothetical protein
MNPKFKTDDTVKLKENLFGDQEINEAIFTVRYEPMKPLGHTGDPLYYRFDVMLKNGTIHSIVISEDKLELCENRMTIEQLQNEIKILTEAATCTRSAFRPGEREELWVEVKRLKAKLEKLYEEQNNE